MMGFQYRVIVRSGKGRLIPELYPTEEILNWWKSLTPEQQQNDKYQMMYVKLYYRDVLSKLNPYKVGSQLQGKTLLCYEKPPQFCHRHIVSVWLNLARVPCEERFGRCMK